MGDELMPWHLNWMTNLDYDRVDLVKEGANSQAHIKIIKQRGGITMDLDQILAKLEPAHRSVVEKALKDKDEAVTAEVAKAKKAEEDLAVAQTEVEKLKAEAPIQAGQSDEDILKTIKDPAVKALLESQIAKTKVAEEQVRKAAEAQLDSEAIAKAKETPGIGADEATLATVYKKLKTVDAKLCEDVFGIFKAASAAAQENGIFKEAGTVSRQAGVAKNEQQAWAAIEEVAKGIRGLDEKLTVAQSVSKAISANPELYASYLKAQLGD